MTKNGTSTAIRLQYSQIRKLAQEVGALERARTVSDLKSLAFSALEAFGAGSLISFEKFNLTGTEYEVSYNGPSPSKEDVDLFSKIYHQHPYIDYLAKGGAELAVRPTDLIVPKVWKKTVLFNELYVKNQGQFGLCSRVHVPETGRNLNFTMLRDREFSDAEQALTRAYLEETRRVFARIHLSSDPVEAHFISNCQLSGLSKREVEVITHVFKGRTDKEIAQALGNSQKTVQHQLQSIYRKLRVTTRSEAVRRLLSWNQ